ncbi:hypothetical protein [Xanthocytophaga agilis]|uniref:Uncharacterized protein n=1 Tax=Xanthocytophaga agilis TaxID=3048010 RepID=A0AAE3RDI3_9BACT|nr:hypothetical protein [Xanthocytophaga agilis]MDJ1505748.1 hypothetical protein [Xanthocytophaga agilis]
MCLNRDLPLYNKHSSTIGIFDKPLFLQAETEALNYPYFDDREDKRRNWVVNPLAGLSLNINTEGKSFFQITVLYNFNYNNEFNKQLYNSPGYSG